MKNFYSFSQVILIVFLLAFQARMSVHAQNSSSQLSGERSANISKLAGNWILQDANIKVTRSDIANRVSKENSMWADHLSGEKSVIIKKDGGVEYSSKGTPVMGKAGIAGNQITFSFESKNTVKAKIVEPDSYMRENEEVSPENKDDGALEKTTVVTNNISYEYTLSGNTLTLRNSNHLFSEEFVFKRK